MSMIVGTCSIPTGHASTHAMQVVHAHRTSSGISGSEPLPCCSSECWYRRSRRSRISCRGARGEPAAVAGQTAVQRPHSVHENASSTCFQLRSASEATPTRPSGGRSRAATGGGRRVRDRQRPLRAARRELAEEHVGDRGDDVEVLGQRQQAQEDEDRRAVQPPSDLADGLRRRAAQAAERGGRRGGHRREVPLVAFDVVRDQAAGVVQQTADHDEQDEEEDHDALPVGGIAVALLGAADGEQARGVGDQPPVEHVDHADDHDDLEQVAGEEERGADELVRPEAGNVPARVERPTEQQDHLDHQDDEAPEDQRVHDSRRLLAAQELLLAEPVDDRAPEALRHPVEAGRRPRAQQEPRPAGDDPGEHEHPDRPHDRERDLAHVLTPARAERPSLRLLPFGADMDCGARARV